MRKIDIDHRTEIDKRYEVYTHTQITIDFIAYNMRHPLGRDFFSFSHTRAPNSSIQRYAAKNRVKIPERILIWLSSAVVTILDANIFFFYPFNFITK